METYPNQRILRKSTFEKCNSECPENYYMKLNLNALESALHDLNNLSSIKLFLYFSKNQETYTFAISSKHVMDYCNMSRDSYNRAFAELEEKGYLVKQGNKREYEFIQCPDRQ